MVEKKNKTSGVVNYIKYRVGVGVEAGSQFYSFNV